MEGKITDYLETLPSENEGEPSEKDMAEFIKFAKAEGKKALSSFKDVLVVNHFDSDGLSSGAIVAIALKEKKIPFKILTVKKMNEKVMAEVKKDPAKNAIFVDIGTGFLKQLNELARSGKRILQIDHHPPEEISHKADSLDIINCHRFNIDGSFYLCSSSGAYFTFASSVSPKSTKRMAQLGIVGAVGDIQDVRGFRGLNRIMLEDAKKLKIVEVRRDLRLFGRVSRSLVNFLNFSSEPFLPGLTGNAKNCALFLRKNQIPLYKEENSAKKWLRYYDLHKDDRIKLIGAILNYCYEKGISEDTIKSTIGDVYLFPSENHSTELYDAYEFSSMLNACGRTGNSDAGIRLGLGEEGGYEEAHLLLQKHRMEISKAIMHARRYAEDMGAFYLLDGRGEISDSIIGTVAGSFFNSGSIERNKPIIALSIDENNDIKASARGWKGLIEKGLNLGKVMAQASEEAGGFGGGHSIAAGASFPNSDPALKKFLLKFKKEVKQALGN